MAIHAPSTGASTGATTIPVPPPMIMGVLSRFDRDQLAGFIAVAIDLLDLAESDPDTEPDDEDEAAYPEWTSLPGSTKRAGHFTTNLLSAAFRNHEDAEDEDRDSSVEDSPEGFDPEEDYCTAGDDGVFSGNTFWSIESKYFCADNPGCEDDAEREQMRDDVPTLKVFSAHENIFTDQRHFLGYSNLTTSYRAAAPVRSADTGRMLEPFPEGRASDLPGAPA